MIEQLGINIHIYVKIDRSTERFAFFRIHFFLFCSYIRACFQLVAFVREHIEHKALLIEYSMKLELTRVCIYVCKDKINKF